MEDEKIDNFGRQVIKLHLIRNITKKYFPLPQKSTYPFLLYSWKSFLLYHPCTRMSGA